MAHRIPIKVQRMSLHKNASLKDRIKRMPLHKNASLKDRINHAIRPSIAIHSTLDMFFDPKPTQISWLLVNELQEMVNKGAIIDETDEWIERVIYSD